MLKKYNQHSLLIIIIFAVIFLLVTILINLPFYFRLQRINQKLTTEVKEKASDKDSGINLTAEKFKELEDKVSTYENQFPKVGTELDLILALENIAKASQITQKLTFNQTKKNSTEHINTVPASIELTGSYNGIMNYLEKVKALKPRISIQTVNFEFVGTDLLKATISAETYWIK
jgi:Tfp pilus assembly protein PilO